MTLEELQTSLTKHQLDAYIITHNNMFLGQDLLDEENQILNLTGFSGSAGTLIVMQETAFLCVDGRYEIQASQQVDTQRVQILCSKKGPPIYKWLNSLRGKKTKIVYNSWCNSISQLQSYQRGESQLTFIPDESIIFDNNLNLKTSKVFEYDIEFSGISRIEKIDNILNYIKNIDIDAYLFTAADDVSWLLNLRSDCLPHTPILRAYALLDKSGHVTVFGDNLQADFEPTPGLNVLPLHNLEKTLKNYKHKTIGIDDANTPQQILTFFNKHNITNQSWFSPCQRPKSNKNPVEISGIEAAHLRDGVALCKFLFWISHNTEGLTELDIVAKLHEFRASQPNFYSESFGTIAGFGANGAIIHYQPKAETNQPLVSGSLLLLDSGAQYYDGTTDVTRTLSIGEPSPEMIDDFTLVLKSHIALASAYFPLQTAGRALDIIARSVLWSKGKNYAHGTGHGVGCFLNVHEGPQNLGQNNGHEQLTENMILSIEPGYYKENAYGIRIENLARIIAVNNPDFEEKFLQFKILTLIPIDKRLVNKYLMNSGEISWLNNYHKEVFEKVSPFINEDEKTWLKDACSPL